MAKWINTGWLIINSESISDIRVSGVDSKSITIKYSDGEKAKINFDTPKETHNAVRNIAQYLESFEVS